MTVSSGFFNSVNHDRLYDAEQLSSIFDGIIIDGVYENYGDAFMVTANPEANSSVLIGTGRAWFDHTWTVNDSTYVMQLDPPNVMVGRIDAIAIDVDRTTNVRKNTIVYIKGSESTPSTPPTLINTDLHNQYLIALINRDPGADAPIAQSKIENVVGTTTPIVTGILESQNLDNLWQQLEDEFDTWWDGIKDTLDTNTVTNLQNQINDLKEKIEGEDALIGLLEKPIAEAFMSGDYHIKSGSFSVSGGAGYYPQITFLPDGKILSVYGTYGQTPHDDHGVAQAAIPSSLHVVITDTKGVSKDNSYSTTTFQYSDLPSDSCYVEGFDQVKYGTIYYYMNGGSDVTLRHDTDYWYIYKVDAEQYPVKIYALRCCTGGVGAQNDNGSWLHDVFVPVIATVQSTGVVSFSQQDYLFTDQIHGTSSGGFRVWSNDITTDRAPIYNELNSSGDTIYVSIGGRSGSYVDNTRVYTVMKCGANGVCSSAKVVYGGPKLYYSNFIIIKSNNTDDNFYIYSDPDAVNSNKTPFGIANIDTYNLNITSGTPTEQAALNKHTAKCSAYLYSLSEENGLVQNGITEGQPNTDRTSSKIMNYFLGANNSGNAIPEGNFSAYEDNGRYYGVGPNGEQIAIGTNGGAAVLKKTVSVPSSLDLSKVNTFRKGTLNKDSVNYYILISNTTQYYGKTGNATVYYIGKEADSDA